MKKNYFSYVLRVSIGTLLFLSSAFYFDAQAQINFDQSELNFNGNAPSGVTSLMYGPDGRLYVAEYPGTILIYDVERISSTNYSVTGVESLSGVKNIVNHDDDGTPCSESGSDCSNRETTGLTIAGTASNPVIYVSSSDFRIGAGSGGGNGDVDLDTNSGIITRFTWNGSSWDVVDLVRGLPRSEENHATNGLEVTTIGGKEYLIVAQGGHTNGGSPSENFVYTNEYALSGAILSIDLDAINALPEQTDLTGRKYIYDLPTLDDPTRANVNGIEDPDDPAYDGVDVNDPFGGNDGLNQAMVVSGGPVQILSPGFRNAYDIVVTESGALYVTDNGANQGWGGFPVNEGTPNVTNAYDPLEPGSQSPTADGEYINNEDHLELITTDLQSYIFGSFYGGHPNPIRANPTGAGLYTAPNQNGTDGAVFRTEVYDPDGSTPGSTSNPDIALPANWPPVQTANSVEGDWRGPGLVNPDGDDDAPIVVWGTNTNGIDEYTATNFGGAMQGDLIAGVNTQVLRRVELNADGTLENFTPKFAEGLGGNPLGISCNGDFEIFPGTIWAGTLGGKIIVFEPQDFIECDDPAGNPLADFDNDGYTNQDELDNGTDPCNGGSQPADFDKSAGAPFVSDLNDDDDDNDGILDENDPFQLGDPEVGGSDAFTIPINNDLFNDQQGLGGIFGLGLTGLMNNGDPNPNYLNWLDRRDNLNDPNPNDVLGGAPGLMTSHMTSGTANGITNTQEKGYQYGVQVDQNTGVFTAIGNLINLEGPLRIYGNTAAVGGELGHFIGDGTQSNFIKMVVTTDGITALQEINDVPQPPINITIAEADRPSSEIRFYFMVDPSNGEVTLQYELDGGGRINAGTITAQGSILDAIQQSTQDLAVGFIGTSGTPGVELEGTWDFLNVVGEEPTLSQEIPNITRMVDSADEIIDLDNFFADDYGDANLTYSVENNSDTNVSTALNGNELTLSFPSVTAISDITIRATDNDGYFVEDTFNVTVSDAPVVLYRVNAGGPELAAIDGGMVWGADELLNSSPYLLDPGNDRVYESSTMPVDGSVNQTTTPMEIYATERFDNISGLPNLTYAFPVAEPGNYEVRLYMGNSYSGTSEPGERVFDVGIEGTILPLLNDVDLSDTYGHQTGTVITHTLKVTDGTINISFFHGAAENPLINAIEILDAFENDTPIYVNPIADQIGNEGEQLNGNLAVSAFGGDGNRQYSATGLPPGLVIEPTNGQIGGTISETAATGSPYNVTITVDDSDGLTSDAVSVDFTWIITETFAIRINAGGNQVSPTDIGPKWEDNSTNGAQTGGNYSVNTGSITDFEGTIFENRDSSIPAYMDNSTFAALFQEDRYDPSSAPEMEYTLDLDNGDYVVNLYLANAYDGANQIGDRIFDILIEGVSVESDFDVIDRFGHEVAGMLSYPVEVTDGELNILFNHGPMENPSVNGIEIFKVDSNNPTLTLASISDKINEITNSVNITASATGGDPNEDVVYYMSGHPDGVSINPSTGEITGNVTVAAASGGPSNDGVHTVVVTAMKPLSAPSSQVFTWTIDSQYLWNDKNENENYTARHENSLVQAGDKFYLMGGRENAKTIDIYDYTSDTWTSLVDSAPFEFNHFQATEYNGLIWIIGAFNTNNFPNEVPADYIWMFDPESQEWIQGPEIPESRRRGSTGLVVYNDKFYIVGGNTIGHNGGYVQWFDEYDPATGIWTPLADAPIARDHFAAVVIADKLYVAAGRQSGGETTWKPTIPQVDVYDFTAGTWSTLPAGQNIPTTRGGASAVNFNNKLVVIGGEVQDEEVYGVLTDDALKVTEEYDPVTSSWKRLPDMNYERHGTQAIVSGPGVHILAGAPSRGGGNQKNMEYLGEDNPVGTPSVASTLSVPSTVVINDGETVDIDLSLIDGNVGVFVKSMEITGADAADFSITSGELENAILHPNDTRTVSVALSGTGPDRTAILTINYGNSGTASIALTNNPDAAFGVTNPGDQYNYEGDAVSLQIEATSPNVTTYSATGLPPNLNIDENTGIISGTIDDGFVSDGSNVFQEDGGLLIIEAETDFNDTAGGFDILTESETTYLLSTTDHFGNTNGQTVSYEFQIDNPGVYRFHMKSDYSGGSSTDKNDIWFKIDNTPDVHFFTVQGGSLTSTTEFENILGGGVSSKTIYYPAGNAEGRPDYGSLNPGVNGFFKLYRSGSGGNKWDGQTIDSNGFPVYVYFPSTGTYTIQTSERSEGHKLDRFALAHIDLVGTGEPIDTLDGPESQQGEGTQNPGAAVDSPYSVSVNVTDNGDPAGNETVDFLWYIGVSGELIAVPEADVVSGVVPLTVNFTGSNSLDDAGVTSYLWSFNDGTGTTSSQADPTYEFTEIGTYVVDLTVEDADGGSDTNTITIDVTGTGVAPTAVASADITEGEATLEVIFDGSGSTDDIQIESYAWDFGDSNTATEQNPTHSYTTPGIYTAVLTVTDIEGLTDTAELTITVNQPNEAPTAVAMASQESGPAPLQVEFMSAGSSDDIGIISYAWDFGDGGTSTESNPTYIFNTTGVYDVVLTVTDGGGLTGTDTITITVTNQDPIAVIAATPDNGEAPLEVSFTGSGSTDNIAVDSYAWDFGDGATSTEADPVHTYTDPGNYNAELTVTDNEGATATVSVLIQVTQVGGNQAPEAVATANPTEGKAPLPVIFNAGGSSDDVGIDSYFWEFSDGRTSVQMNPVLTFENAGTYDATLTVTDEAGLSDSVTIQIVVTEAVGNQAPEAIVTATPENGNAPLEVSFMGGNSLDDVAIVSYEWDFGDGNSSTETNPKHTYTTPDTFTASLTVTDGEGLTDTATITIQVTEEGGNQAPETVVSATPESGNAPLEVTFTGSDSSDDVAVVAYAWDFGDGTSSSDANPVHTYSEAGNYTAELTVTDGEGLTDTATVEIEVIESESETDATAIIAPNPVPITDETVSIQMSELPESIVVTTIHLHDSMGRLVGTFDPGQTYDNSLDAYRVPVFNLRSGLYYVTLELSDGDPIGIKFLVSN
ncbi:PKD domain-containing protein [Muricauda sp. 334s03]|uniref:PKD domain-containing protein n=1 Tax=Flagellimonas yonaguniensis TaxID=3031325 RepID=A0ABT5Y1T0_9FLAO|nr:PKD domain-containing protein [[Muricauda] yonaguniensis]MDF0717410.1 PKD domain-containing protein [[Muricauda] yonaguniensis]